MSAVNTPGSVSISSPVSTTLIGTMNSPPMIAPDIAISLITTQVPLVAPLSAGADPPHNHSIPYLLSQILYHHYLRQMIAQPLSELRHLHSCSISLPPWTLLFLLTLPHRTR
jgi:hypothetical protein